jgi:hypothetical protein
LATFPERALAWVNGVLVAISDALLTPLADLPPFVSLLLLSLLTAAAMVLVIGRTSDQARLRQTKRRIQAALFEIRLFNDDPRAVLRSAGEALGHNLAYLRLSLVPLAVLAVPLVLLVAHLHPFYGYAGLRPGAAALLEVEWRADESAPRDVTLSLEVPDAIRVEAGPVHLPARRETLWRVRPAAAGEFIVTIHAGPHAIRKTLSVSDAVVRRSVARMRPGIVGQLIHPSEPPLDADGPLARVAVTYPERAIDVLGTPVHWMLVYVALTMGCALGLAQAFRVSL